MLAVVWGVVKNGVIVPNSPLPEGAQVKICLVETSLEVPPELWEELEVWQRASARSLELVERLAQEGAEPSAAT